jgi:hypothetical protein
MGEGKKRELLVEPKEKWEAKDRFGVLGEKVKDPDIKEIIKKIHDSFKKVSFDKEGAATFNGAIIRGNIMPPVAGDTHPPLVAGNTITGE